MTGSYLPTLASLRSHALPAWYADAKLGIFIHWGLFSVPAFAPTGLGDLNQILRREGFDGWFRHIPYSEWYINSMRIPGSPVARFHADTYGADVPYRAFQPLFEDASRELDLSSWARTFAEAGARYVVFVTKHMDGYCLWPAHPAHPTMPGYGSRRDLVGELATAVRARGMRYGVYYSSLLDQSLTSSAMRDVVGFYTEGGPRTREYGSYQLAHWKELIDRYEPSVLWGDIGYPARAGLLELFAYFYSRVPDGVIDDRFAQAPVALEHIARLPPVRRLLNRAIEKRIAAGAPSRNPQGPHFDFATYEYETPPDIEPDKWELCRGMSKGFGYNRNDKPEDHLTLPALVALLAEVVSKNGNLLLNVGPRADGSIPDEQRRLLEGLGTWLGTCGEAIFDTRPFIQAGTTADGGIPVWFTCRGNLVYAIVCGSPARELVLRGVKLPSGRVSLLGRGEVQTRTTGTTTSIELGAPIEAPAIALRFEA